MKVFWRIFAGAAALIVAVMTILFVVWRPAQETGEEQGDLVTYLTSDAVGDDDERLATSYVTSSDSSFFARGRRLAQEMREASRMAPAYLHTFYDQARRRAAKDPLKVFSGAGVLIRLYVTEDCDITDEKGNAARRAAAGDELTATGEKNGSFVLTDGGLLPAAHARRICVMSDTAGTLFCPYAVDIRVPQYLRFDRGGSLYLTFTPDNECVSLFLEGLPAGSSYELFDGGRRKVGCRVMHGEGTLEIYHKGNVRGAYTLRLTCPRASGTVRLTFYRDGNEWDQNMVEVTLDKTYEGVFDYYGDEDFFVVSDDIARDADAVALSLSGADADLYLCAYDRDKNLIGRFIRKRGGGDEVVLYGLKGLYALGVRTVDGAASAGRYGVRFRYVDVRLLGLETYGFKLSGTPDWSEAGDGYLTATCRGLTDKRVVEVLAVGRTRVEMKLTTWSGATYTVKENEPLPLHAGKNTLTITVESKKDTRRITLVITDSGGYDIINAFTVRDAAFYSEPRSTSKRLGNIPAGEKVICYGEEKNGFLKVEMMDGTGVIGWAAWSDLFSDYKICDMPSSYKTAIDRLRKNHPKWKFTFVKTGRSLSQAVSDETRQSPIVWSGDGWTTPSEETVRYYLDPKNFLNDKDIFMFEKQTYHAGTYSEAGIAAIWTEKPEAAGSGAYYGSLFAEAGRVSGLSPYFIAARAALESGSGTSRLAKGEVAGSEGYYNFYGIGAVDTDPAAGGALAKKYGWDSRRKAIIEGAVWIRDQYVSVLQYTPYFIKYSFVPERGWHQYMTDIAAPYKDGGMLCAAHRAGGTYDSEIEFVIPVFD